MSEAPASAATVPESERRRLLRIGMLGCGTALLVLLVLASIVGYLVARHPRQFRSALGAVFTTLEDEIERNFSSQVSPEDRQEFRAARARFHDAWNAGRIDMTAADSLRRRLMQESRKDRMTPEDVRALTRFLDTLAREVPRPLTRSAGARFPSRRRIFASAPGPAEGAWGMLPPGHLVAWGMLTPGHPVG